MKLAFFDSGIGGLTTLSACLSLPCTFYYYGDNEHAPYGTKPKAEILQLAYAAFDRFFALGVDGAVVACNTVTTLCLAELRNRYPFPIFGVEPAIASAARVSSRVLVLCTAATAGSRRLAEMIAAYPKCSFNVYAPPDWVERIERSLPEIPKVSLPFVPGEFDGVVLGCTHFVYEKERLRQYFKCPVFDGNEGLFKHLRDFVGTNNHSKICEKTPRVFFLGDRKKENLRLFRSLF